MEDGGGGGWGGISTTLCPTHSSTDVMDLVVAEWEIDAFWLELSSRDGSVYNTNEGHSIVFIVNNKGIQKLKFHHLLHGSRPSVVL